jgi:putative endonuclease
MFYFIYVLYSHKDKKLYVGCSKNVDKRFVRHKNGSVQSTKHRRPLELIHTEKFSSKVEAFNRERFLKSLWGNRDKKKILENFLRRKNEISG